MTEIAHSGTPRTAVTREQSTGLPRKRTPELGTKAKTKPPEDREGYIRVTLAEGRLVRLHWYGYNDVTRFDIAAPNNLVVKMRANGATKITHHGESPDRQWRHFEIIESPNPIITDGHIAWERDEKGRFTKPVMDPEFEKRQTSEVEQQAPVQNPTLGLE